MGNREHDVASILVAREPPIYIQSHVFLSRIALPRDRHPPWKLLAVKDGNNYLDIYQGQLR